MVSKNYFEACGSCRYQVLSAGTARFGHKLLTIIVRFTPILVSTFDPNSPAQRFPGFVFRISLSRARTYKNNAYALFLVLAERGRFGQEYFAKQNFTTLTHLWQSRNVPSFESPRKQSSLLALSPRTKKAPTGALFCTRGEREIRTPEELSPLTVFKTVPFNRSGISPAS